LSPIIDLFNNEVISYSVSERPAMDMVDEMLIKAFARLEPGNRPVLHSDQGVAIPAPMVSVSVEAIWRLAEYVAQR
jgi:transposase InsO family protein